MKKRIVKVILLILILSMAVALTACRISRVASSGYRYRWRAPSEGVDSNKTIQSGQMTAVAWNDNEHYAEWQALFADATENTEQGKFAQYKQGKKWSVVVPKQIKVTVTEGDAPVSGATVEYVRPDQQKFSARTDANGVAYLFTQEEEGVVTVKSGSATQTASFSAENKDLTVDITGSESKVNAIKIMFVIDATGSMGDEMKYLTTELDDVVRRVTEKAQGVTIDLALLFYRDNSDLEKFAYSDFVRVSEQQGLETQLSVLANQRAHGGGDLPEAVEEALLLATGKDWGTENSTKLIFHVLDAPPHDDNDEVVTCFTAAEIAAEKGIKINPVLCSGAENLCEFVMRVCAMLTGGTTVYVTDDSGIGNSHLNPELPEVTVERLNDLLVRLIIGYHTGAFEAPVPWNGAPTTGK